MTGLATVEGNGMARKTRESRKGTAGPGIPRAEAAAPTEVEGRETRVEGRKTKSGAAAEVETELPATDAIEELTRVVQAELETALPESDDAEEGTIRRDAGRSDRDGRAPRTAADRGEEEELPGEEVEVPAADETEEPDADEDDEESLEGSQEAEAVESPEPRAESREPETDESASETEDDDGEAAFRAEAESKGWPISATRRLWKVLKQNKALKARLESRDESRASSDEGGPESRDERRGPADGHQRAERTTSQAEADLEGEVEMCEGWLEQIDANPNGLTLADDKGRETAYTLEQLRAARKVFARRLRRAEIGLEALHRDRARQTAEATAQATREHAFLRDKTTPEYQTIQKVLRLFPAVRAIPDHLSVLADALAWRAMKARSLKRENVEALQRQNGNGRAPIPARRAPARPVVAPGRAVVNGQRTANLQAAEKQFYETGDLEAGKKVIESMLG